MPIDPSILLALSTGLEKDPDNIPLRMHLAAMLLEGGQAVEALNHYGVVLNRQPDHLEALSRAAQAAELSGDTQRAESYRRLKEALSWKQTKGLIDGLEDRPLPEKLAGTERSGQLPLDDRPLPVAQSAEGDAWEMEGVEVWETEIPEVTLADVAGMEEVKRRLQLSFLAPMQNPEMRRLYGKSLRGGLVMYGPPGCGKTFIARAVAGELGARFIAVSFADIIDMFVGQSERNIHELFEVARRNAPCVLFLDEVDAIGQKRS